jgi:tetratricopeptide (TPR) repeat protein
MYAPLERWQGRGVGMDWRAVFRDSARNYLGLAIKSAGAGLVGPAWPFLEPALKPLLEKLDKRIGKDKTPDERLAAMLADFERDEHLRQVFVSSVQKQLQPLLEGQTTLSEEVSDVAWQLAALVSRSRAALSDEIRGVQDKLDEGVSAKELAPEALEQLAKLVRKQVQEAESTRAIAVEQDHRRMASARVHAQRLQVRAVTQLEAGDMKEAFLDAEAAALIVSVVLERAPTDLEGRMQLAMALKTVAQILARSGKAEAADRAIDDAEQLFLMVKTQTPTSRKSVLDLANAIHGLGNVHAARGQSRRAADAYKTATELEPGHYYAWHDLILVLDGLARDGDVNVELMDIALEGLRSAVSTFAEGGDARPQGIDDERLSALAAVVDQWR